MNPAIHAAHHRNYLPAAGRDVFLPAYDFVTRAMGADRVRNAFVQQAGIQPGLRIPDIGCGAGTLAIFVKHTHPLVAVIGLDPDPKTPARDSQKADRASVALRSGRGLLR
ncbi:MAG TPA: hypothetical protein VJN43_09450 [Bryobacteraceae bacterium]|nr:hypothetical protein [Bryobacteraceae bacterium]